MVERKWSVIPISWVGKQDLLHCRPDLVEQIETLSEADIDYIAEKIGDALEVDYKKLTMDIVLTDYFGVKGPDTDEPGEESDLPNVLS